MPKHVEGACQSVAVLVNTYSHSGHGKLGVHANASGMCPSGVKTQLVRWQLDSVHEQHCIADA